MSAPLPAPGPMERAAPSRRAPLPLPLPLLLAGLSLLAAPGRGVRERVRREEGAPGFKGPTSVSSPDQPAPRSWEVLVLPATLSRCAVSAAPRGRRARRCSLPHTAHLAPVLITGLV